MILKTNKVNSNIPLPEELQQRLGDHYFEKFHDYLEKIEMVKKLVSPNRKYAKDLERDDKGRIKVDLNNLHILEDTDFFRERALFFEEHNRYTFAHPNPSSTSEYFKFWEEERRRCLEGYVRESDGEWITGYYYFYLNYAPIQKVKVVGGEDGLGNVRAERTTAFCDFWDSDYLFFHYVEQAEEEGMFGDILKTRGRGYSFKVGAMGARNFVHIKKSKSYFMAAEKEFLDKDGIYNKFIDAANWCATHTPFPRMRVKQDMQRLHFKSGYTDVETGVEQGWGSEVMGVTMKNDVNKARGKRGKLIAYEESGKFPDLLKAWGIARMSLEQGRAVFGFQIAFGTGGEDGADFEGALEFFYNPKGYKIKSVKNQFDVNGTENCAMFIPEYLNRQSCYDKDGNSNVIKALIEVCEDRRTVRDNSSEPMAIIQEEADRPITPQEAVMKKVGNVFPVQALREAKSKLMSNQILLDASFKGLFRIAPGGFKFDTMSGYKPINKFPIKKPEQGAVEIFEHPIEGYSKLFQRYIIGVDPVDDDGSESGSLQSAFVLDTITKRIVAEYTGRTDLVDEFFFQIMCLAEHYKAMILYENNKKGLYNYFRNKHKTHLLAETPESLKDVFNVTISKIGNKRFGVAANKQLNAFAISRIKAWLTDLAYDSTEEEPKINLETIKSPALYDELIAWHSEGNFDRVSALGIVLIYLSEIVVQIDETMKGERDSIYDDPFYKKMMSDY